MQIKPKYKKGDLAIVFFPIDKTKFIIFEIFNSPRKTNSEYKLRCLMTAPTHRHLNMVNEYKVSDFDRQTQLFRGNVNSLKLLYGKKE